MLATVLDIYFARNGVAFFHYQVPSSPRELEETGAATFHNLFCFKET